jgi:hypothetical protein
MDLFIYIPPMEMSPYFAMANGKELQIISTNKEIKIEKFNLIKLAKDNLL